MLRRLPGVLLQSALVLVPALRGASAARFRLTVQNVSPQIAAW